jgi:hypothetical protein
MSDDDDRLIASSDGSGKDGDDGKDNRLISGKGRKGDDDGNLRPQFL